MAIWCLLNWAGILHVLSLHIAQKAELNHDWKATALLHSVIFKATWSRRVCMVNRLRCADTRAPALAVRGMTATCNDTIAMVPVHTIAMVPYSPTQVNPAFSTDNVFACSEMLPLCGMRDALHLLSATAYVTSVVLSILGRHLKNICLLF